MRREGETGFFEDIGNSLLPGIRVHSATEGDYVSAEEVVEDVEDEWDEYREEWGLDGYSGLEDEFDVSTSGGTLRNEKAVIASSDYRAVFTEDPRTIRERLSGEEEPEGWTAEIYHTSHFGGTENPHMGRFLDSYITRNFRPDSTGPRRE